MTDTNIELIINLSKHAAVLMEMYVEHADRFAIWDDTLDDLYAAKVLIEAAGGEVPESVTCVLTGRGA